MNNPIKPAFFVEFQLAQFSQTTHHSDVYSIVGSLVMARVCQFLLCSFFPFDSEVLSCLPVCSSGLIELLNHIEYLTSYVSYKSLKPQKGGKVALNTVVLIVKSIYLFFLSLRSEQATYILQMIQT